MSHQLHICMWYTTQRRVLNLIFFIIIIQSHTLWALITIIYKMMILDEISLILHLLTLKNLVLSTTTSNCSTQPTGFVAKQVLWVSQKNSASERINEKHPNTVCVILLCFWNPWQWAIKMSTPVCSLLNNNGNQFLCLFAFFNLISLQYF